MPTPLPTTALVTNGLYSYSRNPIYIALTLIYLGLAIVVDSMWSMIFLVPVLALMRYGVIAREERYLERKFDGAYIDYEIACAAGSDPNFGVVEKCGLMRCSRAVVGYDLTAERNRGRAAPESAYSRWSNARTR